MLEMKSRYQGCLIGLAVGDAVGTTLEFKPPGTFKPISDMVGGGPFGLKPGEWTDDTSMALCLAVSLVEKKGFDGKDQMDRYVRWYKHGYMSSTGSCFDIGMTVRSALGKYESTGKAFSGSRDPYAAGNGSIMRLAPVPMYFKDDAQAAIDYSEESSLTTHGADSCVDACRYFGGLIWAALHGVDKETLLGEFYSPVGREKMGLITPEIEEIAAGSFKTKQPPEIKGTGYVVKSLEAALWAFHHSGDFKTGCLLAANLGDDADTTAAIYGQLAGAFYGLEGIPESCTAKVKHLTLISDLALELLERP